MLLSGALFALFMTGIWLYCLTDAILTPVREFRGLSKPAWIAIIAVTFLAGALAWLIVRRPLRRSYRRAALAPRQGQDGFDEEGYLLSSRWTDADDAVARHPAGRAMATEPGAIPRGPDDDPEFLRALSRAINGEPPADEEA
jgi:peptidoglycan/LPS O-acetylase OafA/YrhL